MFFHLPRVAVYGGAGTGKTLIALTHARENALGQSEFNKSISDLSSRKRTLMICKSRLLADVLKTQCQGLEETLHVFTFGQLCGYYLNCAGGNYLKVAQQELPTSDLHDVQLPYAVCLAAQAGGLKYDMIIVDEGQDLVRDQWFALEELLRHPTESSLLVFYDRNQLLRYKVAAECPVPENFRFPLLKNCRNTTIIHNSAYRFYKDDVQIHPPTEIDGAAIQAICDETISLQASAIHQEITGLISDHAIEAHRIVVLVVGDGKKQLYDQFASLSLPNGIKYSIEGSACSSDVRVDTVRQFKGLEADIVFLWGLENVSPTDDVELLYVGLSRAKSRVYLVGRKKDCFAIDSNSVEIKRQYSRDHLSG